MSHETTVTVTNNNGLLSVAVGDSRLKPKGQKNLKWTLSTAGYQFTSDGIAIQNNTGQFTNFKNSNNGQTYTVDDANTDQLSYTYTISVVASSNPALRGRLDPMIQNGEDR